jgi:hypothetical protein
MKPNRKFQGLGRFVDDTLSTGRMLKAIVIVLKVIAAALWVIAGELAIQILAKQ